MIRKAVLSLLFWGCLAWPAAEAKITFPFQGQINPGQREFSASVRLQDDEEPLTLNLSQTAENKYSAVITINDLATPLFEISSVLESTIEVIDDEDRGVFLWGQVESQFALLNHKPFSPFYGVFEIKDRTLYLTDVILGNTRCRGSIQLAAPFRVEMSIELSGVDIHDFIAFFSDQPRLLAEGDVSGVISINGNPDHLYLKGRLMSYDGIIEELDYRSILLNVEGRYPHLYISNSDITQSDGLSFTLKGNLDLSDTQDIRKQIESLAFEPMVKESATDRVWTLKRLRAPDRSGTTELKYLLRKSNGHGPLSGEESGMIGIEQQINF